MPIWKENIILQQSLDCHGKNQPLEIVACSHWNKFQSLYFSEFISKICNFSPRPSIQCQEAPNLTS